MFYRLLAPLWRAFPPSIRRFFIRLSQTTFTVAAAAVVVNDEGKVLILHHLLRPSAGWGLPGGFLDPGEKPEEAVRRELREETGIELTEVRMIFLDTTRKHIEIFCSARSADEPRILSAEIDFLDWYTLEDLPGPIPGNQRRAIEIVLSNEI